MKKRENPARARFLAHKKEGKNFRLRDPPSLPANPSFPNKIKFIGGGLGAGLAAGLGILYVLMVIDQTLHTEKDVVDCLKFPVLASIPILEYGNDSQSLAVPGRRAAMGD